MDNRSSTSLPAIPSRSGKFSDHPSTAFSEEKPLQTKDHNFRLLVWPPAGWKVSLNFCAITWPNALPRPSLKSLRSRGNWRARRRIVFHPSSELSTKQRRMNAKMKNRPFATRPGVGVIKLFPLSVAMEYNKRQCLTQVCLIKNLWINGVHPGACTVKKHNGFIIYGFCSKLMCLFKLVCLLKQMERR